MKCIKDNGYCYGDVIVTKYGNVCHYHEWLYHRCEKNDDKRKDSDDGYGLQMFDNALFDVEVTDDGLS